MSETVRFSNDERVFKAAERLYGAIEGQLRRLLPQADIRHVGSTAVPGSMTKGDLDVVVRVQPADFKLSEELLGAKFDRNTGSERTHDFSAFKDDSATPDLGIQLVAVGGPADNFHIWVQQLLDDPTLRRQYDELKLKFEGRDMEEYRLVKSDFITRNIRR
jgi:GrpB-like predicted nucleotidyltransferase (UPF0157 family)